MHWRPLVLILLWATLRGIAAAEDGGYDDGDLGEPYRGYANADDVYVRSGPGQNYYPVLRLRRGETVDVYRHDPGGWYAIRPPADCFSWVSAEFVEPGEGRMAMIKGQHVVARVGSAFSDIRDVIQVRLDEGEQVEVLEAKRIGSGPAAQTWYKIAPPAGEFRWVSGQFIDREAPTHQAHQRDPNKNLLIARHARRNVGDDPPPPHERGEVVESRYDRLPSAGEARQRRSHDETLDDDDEFDPGKREVTPRKTKARRAETDEPRERRTEWVPPPSPRRKPVGPSGDKELLQELEELDLALSTEVAKDPAAWNLRQLRWRVDTLLSQSDTALDRGRVRLVQRKVARFEDIKQRHDAIGTAQLATDLRNQDLVRASLGGSLAARPDGGRYDGVGKLTQVYPAQSGVASFALVDNEGRVTQYVTAAPGVNLRPYLGQEVGVQGSLGYMPDAKTPHVMAKRVTVVEGSRLVR